MRLTPFLLFPGICSAAAVVLPRQDGEVDYMSYLNQHMLRQEGNACTNPAKRFEYRTLDAATQKDYTDSVWCMTKKPSRLGLNTTLYDDFTYVHASLNADIHFVAQFLPWHRYFVHLYETAIRECGYTGPMAYWDWTLDTDDPVHSSIWDPVRGMGGNGVSPPGVTDRSQDAILEPVTSGGGVYFCVADGPFGGMNVSYFHAQYRPRCLSRNFNAGLDFPGTMFSFVYSPSAVADVVALPDYDAFRQDLEGKPHAAIHSSTGGDMGPSSSPNDPLFFLHHVQIDRLWSQWQQADPEVRTREYAGRRTHAVPESTNEVALDDLMPFMGFAPDLQVADVMSHKTSLLCYEY